MGRKGSRLIPFLIEGICENKYVNLKKVEGYSGSELIFTLNLPHKTNKLSTEMQRILKDWYRNTGKNYIHNHNYTKAKQGMMAALRQSDFLRILKLTNNSIVCEILRSPQEIEAKKLIKKEKRQQAKYKAEVESMDYYNPPSEVSSGYFSGVDSPGSCGDYSESEALAAINHDHSSLVSTDPLLSAASCVPVMGYDIAVCDFVGDTVEVETIDPVVASADCDEGKNSPAAILDLNRLLDELGIVDVDANVSQRPPFSLGELSNCDAGISTSQNQPFVMDEDGNCGAGINITQIQTVVLDELANCGASANISQSQPDGLDDLLNIPDKELIRMDSEAIQELLSEYKLPFEDVPAITTHSTETVYVQVNCAEKILGCPVIECEPKECSQEGTVENHGLKLILDERGWELLRSHQGRVKETKMIGGRLLIILGSP